MPTKQHAHDSTSETKPKARRTTPYFGTTLAESYTQYLDQIDAAGGFARVAAHKAPSIGRAGVLRGIIEGVQRLGLDFSGAVTAEEIADLIAGTKARTRK